MFLLKALEQLLKCLRWERLLPLEKKLTKARCLLLLHM